MRASSSFTKKQKKELNDNERGISTIGKYKKYLTVRLRERLDMSTFEISEVIGY